MSKSWSQPVQPYAKQVAIIQSSETGKSRMVHELSKLTFEHQTEERVFVLGGDDSERFGDESLSTIPK